MNRKTRVLSILMLFAVTLAAFPMKAADNQPLTKKQLKFAIPNAKTPAEHRAIADYYRHEAQHLIAKSKEHHQMAAEYVKHPLPYEGKHVSGSVGASHCRDLASRYATEAKNAESLAAQHEDMARTAEGK